MGSVNVRMTIGMIGIKNMTMIGVPENLYILVEKVTGRSINYLQGKLYKYFYLFTSPSDSSPDADPSVPLRSSFAPFIIKVPERVAP